MPLRIALINPVTRTGKVLIRTGRCQARCLPGIGLWPPIGLAQIATAVRRITEVRDVWLLDAAVEDTFDTMLRKIREYSPDIAIINCTTPTFYDDLELAEKIREYNQEVLIVMYGTHATARPGDILAGEAGNSADCCIIGEPEQAAADICERYAALGRKGLLEVKGIALCGPDKKLFFTGPRKQLADLDSLGIPSRDLLDNQFYRLPFNGRPFTIIQPSRGCTKKCIYCTAPMFTGKVIYRSVISVADEINEVINNFGINQFMFLSDTFTASQKWVRDLCNEIIARKMDIQWIANSRVDTLDEQTAAIMREAGCWALSLGIESGSPDILEHAHKGIKLEDVRRTVDILKKTGIRTIGYFMFGLPGETHETIKATIQLACRLPIDYAYFYTATPFPGTVFFDEAQKNGWLLSMDWRRYFHGESDVIAYENMPASEISRAVSRAYKAFYFRPDRIIKYISDIKSLDMLYQHMRACFDVLKR